MTRHVDTSIASYLILAGVVLFVIPEPITSFVGVALLFFGLVAWLFEKML